MLGDDTRIFKDTWCVTSPFHRPLLTRPVRPPQHDAHCERLIFVSRTVLTFSLFLSFSLPLSLALILEVSPIREMLHFAYYSARALHLCFDRLTKNDPVCTMVFYALNYYTL